MVRKRRKTKKIRYEFASDLQLTADDLCRNLFPHIRPGFFKCFRSFGSSSRGTIARCHGLAKIMQETIGCGAYYAIEFISERFDKLSEEDKIRTVIHELMHIPENFGGGFRHHNYVSKKNVDIMYNVYQSKRTT